MYKNKTVKLFLIMYLYLTILKLRMQLEYLFKFLKKVNEGALEREAH